MSEQAKPRDGVPEDYPGRVTGFPDGVDGVVFGMFGVQSRDAHTRERFIDELRGHCAREGGPARIERCRFLDAAGFDCEMLLVYGLDRKRHDAWWRDAPVRDWWQALDRADDPETGYWREVVATPKARFNYAAGTEDKVGSAAILPLEPSATFGYWGAYRDRLPASAHDDFASPLDAAPPVREQDTRGRRVTVVPPDNLCLIREGQGWADCGPEEKAIWDAHMDGVVGEWVGFLGSDPQATGCLTIRDCTEQDAATGEPNARRSQLAFLLSLGHIEHAARTQKAHLAVHGAFVKMYREPKFTPRMHVWVEVHVLKHDEIETEYVNCHAGTGMLPFFEARAIG